MIVCKGQDQIENDKDGLKIKIRRKTIYHFWSIIFSSNRKLHSGDPKDVAVVNSESIVEPLYLLNSQQFGSTSKTTQVSEHLNEDSLLKKKMTMTLFY